MKEKVKSNIVLEIERRVKGILENEKIELVDIDVILGKNKQITIYVYSKNKIDLEDLENINKRLNPIIENIPIFNDGFILEISSPGLYRKLKYRREFNLFVGRNIKIITTEGNTYTGISNGINENNLILIIDKNKEIKFNIDNINKAYLNG